MSQVAFVDTETTGLDPDRHEIWEVGLIVDGVERSWLLPVDESRADAVALNIGRYHERHPGSYGWMGDRTKTRVTPVSTFVGQFAHATWGRHLVGAVISFDEERLRKLLRANGVCPGWHYHLIDVEALAAGRLAAEGNVLAAPPWVSENLSAAVGVDPNAFDRHTALGDARWAKAIYDACLS